MKKALLLTTALALTVLPPKELVQRMRNFDKEKTLAKKEAALPKPAETEASVKAVQPIIEQAKSAVKKTFVAKKQKPEKPKEVFYYETEFEYNFDGTVSAEITYKKNTSGQIITISKTEFKPSYCYGVPECTGEQTWNYTYHDNREIATINFTKTTGGMYFKEYEEFSPKGHKLFYKRHVEYPENIFKKGEKWLLEGNNETFYTRINGKDLPIEINEYDLYQGEDTKKYSHQTREYNDEAWLLKITTEQENPKTNEQETLIEKYNFHTWGRLAVIERNSILDSLKVDFFGKIEELYNLNGINLYIKNDGSDTPEIIERIDFIHNFGEVVPEVLNTDAYIGQSYYKLLEDFEKAAKQLDADSEESTTKTNNQDIPQ